MPSVCFYFQVHQPYRVKRFKVFDIGKNQNYFIDSENEKLNNEIILKKVARKCYIPTNQVILKLLGDYPDFKVAFSFSGTLLEQLEQYCPEALLSFQKIVETGRAEVLSETYYHSLSFIYSPEEFRNQVLLHKTKIKELFNQDPQVFRNTELIYNNDLAREVETMGYKGILIEGADKILGWRSPNFVHRATGTKLKLLLKHYKLSDDIAFRFSQQDWSEYPLTSKKFASWLESQDTTSDLINLFMDYETFGEHHFEDSGILRFLAGLPGEILKGPNNRFVTPSEALDLHSEVGELDVPDYMSWADMERDLSAWIDNSMQKDALDKLYLLKKKVLSSGDAKLIEDWRRLQTSDHFYYMCTKYFADGDVHKYFNPYETPYEAFINYMNALSDLNLRVRSANTNKKSLKDLTSPNGETKLKITNKGEV